jgi:hypothetical protein
VLFLGAGLMLLALAVVTTLHRMAYADRVGRRPGETLSA